MRGAIDVTEAFAFHGVEFEEVSESSGLGGLRIAVPCLVEKSLVGTVCRAGEEVFFAVGGDGSGKEIDGTAGGVRAVFHLGRTFQELDGGHPAGFGRVVSGGRRIGRGGGQNSVLHQRDFVRAGAINSPECDVGEISVAILIPHENGRNLGGDAGEVRLAA